MPWIRSGLIVALLAIAYAHGNANVTMTAAGSIYTATFDSSSSSNGDTTVSGSITISQQEGASDGTYNVVHQLATKGDSHLHDHGTFHVHHGNQCGAAGGTFYHGSDDPWVTTRFNIVDEDTADIGSHSVMAGVPLDELDGRAVVIADANGKEIACSTLHHLEGDHGHAEVHGHEHQEVLVNDDRIYWGRPPPQNEHIEIKTTVKEGHTHHLDTYQWEEIQQDPTPHHRHTHPYKPDAPPVLVAAPLELRDCGAAVDINHGKFIIADDDNDSREDILGCSATIICDSCHQFRPFNLLMRNSYQWNYDIEAWLGRTVDELMLITAIAASDDKRDYGEGADFDPAFVDLLDRPEKRIIKVAQSVLMSTDFINMYVGDFAYEDFPARFSELWASTRRRMHADKFRFVDPLSPRELQIAKARSMPEYLDYFYGPIMQKEVREIISNGVKGSIWDAAMASTLGACSPIPNSRIAYTAEREICTCQCGYYKTYQDSPFQLHGDSTTEDRFSCEMKKCVTVTKDDSNPVTFNRRPVTEDHPDIDEIMDYDMVNYSDYYFSAFNFQDPQDNNRLYEQNPNIGKNCTFPFYHKGTKYNGCARLDANGEESFDRQRRCAVEVNEETGDATEFGLCVHSACHCQSRAEFECECDAHQGLVAEYEFDPKWKECVIGCHCRASNDPADMEAPHHHVIKHGHHPRVQEHRDIYQEVKKTYSDAPPVYDRDPDVYHEVQVIEAKEHGHHAQTSSHQHAYKEHEHLAHHEHNTVANAGHDHVLGVYGGNHTHVESGGTHYEHGTYSDYHGTGTIQHDEHAHYDEDGNVTAVHRDHIEHSHDRSHGHSEREGQHMHEGDEETVTGMHHGETHDHSHAGAAANGHDHSDPAHEHEGHAAASHTHYGHDKRTTHYGITPDGAAGPVRQDLPHKHTVADSGPGYVATYVKHDDTGDAVGNHENLVAAHTGAIEGHSHAGLGNALDHSLGGHTFADGDISTHHGTADAATRRRRMHTGGMVDSLVQMSHDTSTHTHETSHGHSPDQSDLGVGHHHDSLRDCGNPDSRLVFQALDHHQCPESIDDLVSCDEAEGGEICDGTNICDRMSAQNCQWGDEKRDIFQAIVIWTPTMHCSNHFQRVSVQDASDGFSLDIIPEFYANDPERQNHYHTWCKKDAYVWHTNSTDPHVAHCEENQFTFIGTGFYTIRVQVINPWGQSSACDISIEVHDLVECDYCKDPDREYVLSLVDTEEEGFVYYDLSNIIFPGYAGLEYRPPFRGFEYYTLQCYEDAATTDADKGEMVYCETPNYKFKEGLTFIEVFRHAADECSGKPICHFVVEVTASGREDSCNALLPGEIGACPVEGDQGDYSLEYGNRFLQLASIFDATHYFEHHANILDRRGVEATLTCKNRDSGEDCEINDYDEYILTGSSTSPTEYEVTYHTGVHSPPNGAPAHNMYWRACAFTFTVSADKCHEHIEIPMSTQAPEPQFYEAPGQYNITVTKHHTIEHVHESEHSHNLAETANFAAHSLSASHGGGAHQHTTSPVTSTTVTTNADGSTTTSTTTSSAETVSGSGIASHSHGSAHGSLSEPSEDLGEHTGEHGAGEHTHGGSLIAAHGGVHHNHGEHEHGGSVHGGNSENTHGGHAHGGSAAEAYTLSHDGVHIAAGYDNHGEDWDHAIPVADVHSHDNVHGFIHSGPGHTHDPNAHTLAQQHSHDGTAHSHGAVTHAQAHADGLTDHQHTETNLIVVPANHGTQSLQVLGVGHTHSIGDIEVGPDHSHPEEGLEAGHTHGRRTMTDEEFARRRALQAWHRRRMHTSRQTAHMDAHRSSHDDDHQHRSRHDTPDEHELKYRDLPHTHPLYHQHKKHNHPKPPDHKHYEHDEIWTVPCGEEDDLTHDEFRPTQTQTCIAGKITLDESRCEYHHDHAAEELLVHGHDHTSGYLSSLAGFDEEDNTGYDGFGHGFGHGHSHDHTAAHTKEATEDHAHSTHEHGDLGPDHTHGDVHVDTHLDHSHDDEHTHEEGDHVHTVNLDSLIAELGVGPSDVSAELMADVDAGKISMTDALLVTSEQANEAKLAEAAAQLQAESDALAAQAEADLQKAAEEQAAADQLAADAAAAAAEAAELAEAQAAVDAAQAEAAEAQAAADNAAAVVAAEAAEAADAAQAEADAISPAEPAEVTVQAAETAEEEPMTEEQADAATAEEPEAAAEGDEEGQEEVDEQEESSSAEALATFAAALGSVLFL